LLANAVLQDLNLLTAEIDIAPAKLRQKIKYTGEK